MKFVFDKYKFEENKLSLYYYFSNGMDFVETIEFKTNKKFSKKELEALNNVFKYIHIVCGISYYKLFCPKDIEIKTFDLTEKEAKFFNSFYYNGLGEFSCKNNILDLEINFPYSKNKENKANDIKLVDKILIPIGGGKDSTTTLEIIKDNIDNNKIVTCSIGIAKPILETIKISGCNSFHPTRTISKNLLELNKKLSEINGYNGHVPISGILAFIMAACSIIYDFKTILISNERSANFGNREFNGRIVNHQWSKSLEFEKEVNSFFKEFVLSDLEYISFLRPLTEIHIAKLFSKLTKYHEVFTSCNKSFKIENRLENWCCNCDKCRFVFLILSIFLDKNKLIKIFGKNLLDDESQLEGYKELCGLKNHKPFECVGEIEESIYSIQNVNESFKDDFVVKNLKKLLKNNTINRNFFDLSSENILTKQLFEMLNKYINKNSFNQLINH